MALHLQIVIIYNVLQWNLHQRNPQSPRIGSKMLLHKQTNKQTTSKLICKLLCTTMGKICWTLYWMTNVSERERCDMALDFRIISFFKCRVSSLRDVANSNLWNLVIWKFLPNHNNWCLGQLASLGGNWSNLASTNIGLNFSLPGLKSLGHTWSISRLKLTINFPFSYLDVWQNLFNFIPRYFSQYISHKIYLLIDPSSIHLKTKSHSQIGVKASMKELLVSFSFFWMTLAHCCAIFLY